MQSNKGIHIVSFGLVVVGALNWGLIGLFSLDLIGAILGSVPAIERIVYVLVGLGAVYLLVTHKKDCHVCMAMDGAGTAPSDQTHNN